MIHFQTSSRHSLPTQVWALATDAKVILRGSTLRAEKSGSCGAWVLFL